MHSTRLIDQRPREPIQTPPDLKTIKLRFNAFLKLNEIRSHSEFNNLMILIQDLEKIDDTTPFDEDPLAKNFSSKLNLLLNINALMSLKINADSLGDLLYELSLLLASKKITNPKDIFSLDVIKPHNRLILSNRYQYDIKSLFEFVKHNSFERLANPTTRVPFNEQDKETILKALKCYAKRANKELVIKTGPLNSHPQGDPDLDATLNLVNRLASNHPIHTPVARLDFDGTGFFNRNLLRQIQNGAMFQFVRFAISYLTNRIGREPALFTVLNINWAVLGVTNEPMLSNLIGRRNALLHWLNGIVRTHEYLINREDEPERFSLFGRFTKQEKLQAASCLVDILMGNAQFDSLPRIIREAILEGRLRTIYVESMQALDHFVRLNRLDPDVPIARFF